MSAFSPHPSQTHLPPLLPPSPLGFVHVSFIVVPESFPPLSPHLCPLAIVKLFLILMSLVTFCLLVSLVDYFPVKGEIIWYLSLTAWLISLGIMLSSSIHAVTKGRFFHREFLFASAQLLMHKFIINLIFGMNFSRSHIDIVILCYKYTYGQLMFPNSQQHVFPLCSRCQIADKLCSFLGGRYSYFILSLLRVKTFGGLSFYKYDFQ